MKKILIASIFLCVFSACTKSPGKWEVVEVEFGSARISVPSGKFSESDIERAVCVRALTNAYSKGFSLYEIFPGALFHTDIKRMEMGRVEARCNIGVFPLHKPGTGIRLSYLLSSKGDLR